MYYLKSSWVFICKQKSIKVLSNGLWYLSWWINNQNWRFIWRLTFSSAIRPSFNACSADNLDKQAKPIPAETELIIASVEFNSNTSCQSTILGAIFLMKKSLLPHTHYALEINNALKLTGWEAAYTGLNASDDQHRVVFQ